MTGRRRWWWRLVLAALVYGLAMAGALLLRDDPDPVRMALVVAVLVATGALLVDASRVPSADWPLDPVPTTGLSRADPRTAAYLRVLEGHLTAAEADHALRDRLRDLTDLMLRDRHALAVADPRAEAVLGPELTAVLMGPVRRLGPARIEQLVSRIEAL